MEANEKQMQYLTEREKEIIKSFPGLTEDKLKKANDLFTHYLIYKSTNKRNREREVWTSCCHHHECISYMQELVTAEMRDALEARHNDRILCPFCGAEVTVKCRGKFHDSAYGAVVFLGADAEGNLFAQCYGMEKDYEFRPEAEPHYRFDCGYWFTPGRTLWVQKIYGYGRYGDGEYFATWDEGKLLAGKHIREPFLHGWGPGMGHDAYAVIGLEALGSSFARYCDDGRWHEGTRYSTMMRWLLACSIYPRQVEMLQKAGQDRIVQDLVHEGRKDARFFKWEETDPRRAFRMDGKELKTYLESKKGIEVLQVRSLIKSDLKTAIEWMEGADGLHAYSVEELVKLAKLHGLEPAELRKYFLRFTGPRCHGMGWYGTAQVMQLWKDYLANAESIGMDIRQRNILLPRDLQEAHDNAAEIMRKRKERSDRDKRKGQNEAAKAREKVLNDRYGFATEHYLIRAPHSAEEIIREGRRLEHCVGGYAARHAEGKVTILFLRDRKHPQTPLCTIEMNGNCLVQIHGLRNERDKGSIDPKLRFTEIYEPWIAWVKADSKRRKDGTPIVPKKKGAKTA